VTTPVVREEDSVISTETITMSVMSTGNSFSIAAAIAAAAIPLPAAPIAPAVAMTRLDTGPMTP